VQPAAIQGCGRPIAALPPPCRRVAAACGFVQRVALDELPSRSMMALPYTVYLEDEAYLQGV